MASFDSSEMLEAIEFIEKGDYLTAFQVLTSPALGDNRKAQRNLANLYHFGWGVSANGKKAVELYLGVARGNIREDHLSGLAYNNLATIYTTGLPGIDVDPEKAHQYLKQARELGFEM